MSPNRALALACALACACGAPAPKPLAATRVVSHAYDPLHDDYFAAPWPDDRRLNPDGTLSTIDFPNPERGAGFDTSLQSADRLVHGWSLSAPIYLPFTGAIDTATLPATPAASLAKDASVFLEAIDPASPHYRKRVPLEWQFFDSKTLWLPGNVLAIRPVVGFPLEPKTRYALVVTTRVKDAKGAPVGPEASMRDALSGSGAEASWWKPLVALAKADGLATDDLAGATIFTTQPILDDLLAIRDYVNAQPAPTVQDLKFVRTQQGYTLFTATYQATNFEHGAPPYEFDGGDFEWTKDGQPVPGPTETMRLSLCIPNGAVPSTGLPVVFYSHGTGGDYLTDVDDDTCALFATKGIAVTGIDQVLNGTRAPKGSTCFGQDASICFFNPINAPSGRDTIRQSAIDHVALRKLVAGLTIPSSVDPQGRTVVFDLTKTGFFGHSQGGLTGALYSALDPDLKGAMLSGAGGHLTTTLLLRKIPDPNGDPNGGSDLKSLLEGPLFLGIGGVESLNQFHPALAIIQTLGDVADPLSYARYWLREPVGGRRNLFLTSGYHDTDTPNAAAEALAIAGGLPQLVGGERDNPSFALAGLPPVLAPVTDDVAASSALPAVTAGFREFPDGDHFVIFDDQTARAQLAGFFQTLFSSGVATIPAP